VKAKEAQLLRFLQGTQQFIIPIYQRTYSWTRPQCQQLWNDIVRAATDESVSAHFVGSVVYIEKGLYQISSVSPQLVIDGQQRLTTISLLLVALGRALQEQSDGGEISQKKINNYYLLNPEEDGNLRYKLLLTQNDRETLMRIVEERPVPEDASLRIIDNYQFFDEQVRTAGIAPGDLFRGISKLMVVDIALDRDHDNPQLIFESLNSTGLELSQADLIRNYILMGLEPNQQEALYRDYWHPMERSFGQADYAAHFDRFMRDYLTVKTGLIPRIDEVYARFKAHSQTPAAGQIDEVVADIHRFSGYFVRIAFHKEPDAQIREVLNDINTLKVDVAYPFLLEAYDDYAAGRVSRAELLEILRLIESYVFRRAICGIPTNSLNKTFQNLARELDKERYLESFKAALLLKDSYRRFPRDEEFRAEFQVKDVYNLTNRRNYLLRKLENHGRKEPVDVETYTIEHILPQNENLYPEWRAELGQHWQAVQERYLHTIGNLTLTGYNPELSDRPFAEKRDMTGGFRDSPIRLNHRLASLERWNEDEIRARAADLADLAVEVWPSAELPPAVWATYSRKAHPAAGPRSLEEYPLLTGPLRELFDQLCRRILNLDASVSEAMVTNYILYQTASGTPLVAVVPQKSQLRLTLNLEFSQIDDPEGRCTDGTGKGYWGYGDVIVGLWRPDQLDYVMFLVRQVFTLRNEDDGA
jgi:uncharacterized protein with ParB-like and HNH nuclease domain/predicted transport protein